MRDTARGLTAAMNMLNEYRRLIGRHGFSALAADVRNRAQWMLIGAGYSEQDAKEMLDTAESEAFCQTSPRIEKTGQIRGDGGAV